MSVPERGAAGLSGKDACRLSGQEALDYPSLGFRCGLEIHQQLDTRKLFSPCPSEVLDPDEVRAHAVATYTRRLRATASELGEVDVAAAAEARRDRRFRYLAVRRLTSLVELDEEPPHPLCPEALDATLSFAGLLGARPVDEVHVMRKTVIDGSNTSGFQRTCLVATGGTIDVSAQGEGPDVGVWTIAVEEDSARKVEESDGLVTYSLDRLGIPLVEVATAPDVVDPAHAQRTAARIGALLRATGCVKRGLGTIRQDLNVSIGVGDRVEIKGCQDLRSVPRVVEAEVRRQLWLHHVAEALDARGFSGDDVAMPVDITEHLHATDAKLVQGTVRRGGRVLALALPKWAGLIKGQSTDGPRMGREFADHAAVAAGVKGIFHSDELPAYGIRPDEVDAIHNGLGLGPDDAFILCAAPEDVARRALDAVARRARDGLHGTLREVRAAQEDGSTRYMRPLPGAARMYPETDVPPVPVPSDHWAQVLAGLPQRPEERLAGLVKRHGVSRDVAGQLVREGRDASFEDLVENGAEPAIAARCLLQFLPGLTHPEQVLPRLEAVLAAQRGGAFAKEAVPDVLAALDAEPGLDMDEAARRAGAGAADAEAVDAVVQRVVGEREAFVKERGMAAIGPLMGPVMAELRGKADGQLVSERLKAELQRRIQG